MKLKIYNDEQREDFIEKIRKVKIKRPYVAEFKPHRKCRSIPQNSLYWLWISCVADETGNDKLTLHDYFRSKYLPIKELRVFESPIRRLTSTTELDTKQFTHYLDRIQQDMLTEEGISLPNPNDMSWDSFYEKYKDFIV